MRSKRPPEAIIEAARGQIARILAWTHTMTAGSFQSDERTRYACERAFIALGEALADLGGKIDLTTLAPEGPWAEAVRFRHFLAHDYDDSAIPPLVSDTTQHDLPDLDATLAKVGSLLARRSGD